MHEGAGRNIRLGKTNRHVVFQNRLAFGDGARGHLVARGHLALAGQAVAQLRAERNIGARDQHVVRFMQTDGEAARRRFVMEFDHVGTF